MNVPQKHHLPTAELAQRASFDLVVRLIHGTYAFAIFPILLASTTSYRTDHSNLFWAVVISILAGIGLRIAVFAWRGCIYAWRPGLLIPLCGLAICLTSGACGILLAGTERFYGIEAWPFTLILLLNVGVATGSTITFTPNFRLLELNIFVLFAPSQIVALLTWNAKSGALLLMTCGFIAFMLLQGYRLHKIYWRELRDRELKVARARELEEARKTAVEANESKSQFVANMSHEIRTPLHGILGMAQLAADAKDPDECRAYIRTLSKSAQSLLQIINDILDFSKIEAGKLTLEEANFSLRYAVAEVCQLAGFQARIKGLGFNCHVASEIPDDLIGDPTRIRQVLVNLLGNAVKFTSSGSVTLRIARTVAAPSQDRLGLVFQVSDTGIGIPEEQHEHIFQSFAQADGSVTRRFGGTGLGLAICAQLANLMDGSISLRSAPGRGSVFEFSCILQVAAGQPLIPEPAAASPEVEVSMRILLAEDNPVNQMLARALLTGRGHKVTVASNGLEAIREWNGHEFDVVLMDEQMPEMSGVEAARYIRAREAESGRKRTPIVALTASAMTGDRERFLASGMDDYLAKPFNAEQLYAVIGSLGRTRLQLL